MSRAYGMRGSTKRERDLVDRANANSVSLRVFITDVIESLRKSILADETRSKEFVNAQDRWEVRSNDGKNM
jgi:hypothetical protein